MKTKIYFILFSVMLSLNGFSQDENEAVPLPLPEWSAPVSYSSCDHYLKGYNVDARSEFIADSTFYQGINEIRTTTSFIPEDHIVYDENPGNRSMTPLELIENPAGYPRSGNVKLFIKFPNSGSTFIGSGILISKNVVLTAGHCIYDKDLGGWADWVKVVPAYNFGTEPYGHSYAKTLYSWHAWTDNENFDWDMGAIALDWCIGLECGFFGHGTYHDQFFFTNTFHNYSYPGASPYDGSRMYYRKGSFDNATSEILYFNNLSYGGQSGSGFFYKDVNGNRCAYAVLSHSNSTLTGCTRITSPKFDYLCTIIKDNNACSYTVLEEKAENQTLVFNAYPNPVKEKITVTFGEARGALRINIYDVLSNLLISETINQNETTRTLDTSDLLNGCYIIRISDGYKSSSRTFVKTSQ